MELVRKEFCIKRGIGNVHQVMFISQGINPANGNFKFSVEGGGISVAYEHERYNVRYLSNSKTLTPDKTEAGLLKDKDNMANWVNSKFNLKMLPEDIMFVIQDNQVITVVMDPNSMRFRESFTISI